MLPALVFFASSFLTFFCSLFLGGYTLISRGCYCTCSYLLYIQQSFRCLILGSGFLMGSPGKQVHIAGADLFLLCWRIEAELIYTPLSSASFSISTCASLSINPTDSSTYSFISIIVSSTTNPSSLHFIPKYSATYLSSVAISILRLFGRTKKNYSV